MENRAVRGVRLVSQPILEGNRSYVYTIGWHVPAGMFYLEEEVTHLDEKPPKTLGKIIAFAKRVNPLIRHIEERRNVKIRLAEDISDQEHYAVMDGERILKKYPRWRSSPSGIPVIG